MRKETGQVVIILLLVVVVALAAGLSIAGRSVSDIATSTRSEDSSKALSAAEAGLERALQQTLDSGTIDVQSDLTNQSQAEVSWDRTLPLSNIGLEYPPLSRDNFAQFWMAKLSDLSKYYDQDSFDIYFGTSGPVVTRDDNPAIEVHVVINNQGKYESRKFYFDSHPLQAGRNDNFTICNSFNPPAIATNNSTAPNKNFYCRINVPYRSAGELVYPLLVRVKLLYTNTPQPIAIIHSSASGNCDQACSLPQSQISIFTSQGTSGGTRRDIQVFQQKQVVPYFFDYALFSSGELQK